MSSNSNLDDAGQSCILDAIYGMETLDMRELRDRITDHVASYAESVCIYTNDCHDIICRYEREVDDSEVDELVGEKRYKATEWTDAMVAYASAVAYVYISVQAVKALDEVEEAADALDLAAEGHGGDSGEPRVTGDCPHGWAVHDREDADGVHYWTEGNLEGCRAVAIKVGMIWLSYTWTPEATSATTTEE